MHFNEEILRPDRRSVTGISSDQVQNELNYLVIGVKMKSAKQPCDGRSPH